MCISAAPAEFTGTIVYGGRRTHPRHGRIEVIGYQNAAANLADGPNAMLLHLPAQGLTQANFLSAGRHGDLLERMVEAVRPVSRGAAAAGAMDWMGADEVQVFEHDVYTIVLAGNPALIPAALERVPQHKRPALSPELFDFYGDVFPRHSVALCCFDNKQARQAKPLFLWYPAPADDRIVLPALDCHTGGVPDLATYVRPDHWVLFGTDDAPDGWGSRVRWPGGVPRDLREVLPYAVIGRPYQYGHLPNGDFALDYADLLAGDVSRIQRLVPGR